MATYNGMTKAKPRFNLNAFIVTGDTATTALTCTGIKTTSKILFILHQSTAAAFATSVMLDLDEVSIPANDQIALASTDTTDDQLEVWWEDPDGDVKNSFHLNCFAVTGGDAAADLTCTGIKTTSEVLFVFHNSTASNIATRVILDKTKITIPHNAIINCSDATNNDQLDVYWTDIEL
jgi:hypothetical protein